MYTKICSKCKEELTIDNFSKDKHKKDGYNYSCKICKSEYKKLLRQNNLERHRIRDKEYYHNNYDVSYKKSTKYCSSEKGKEKILEYRMSDRGKEIARLNQHKRRVLIKATTDGSITIQSTTKLLDEQGGVCILCGLDIMDRTTRHLDHVHPLSRGGTHTIGNVQWLCSGCNLGKGIKLNYGRKKRKERGCKKY